MELTPAEYKAGDGHSHTDKAADLGTGLQGRWPWEQR